jgi:hypothetical protein
MLLSSGNWLSMTPTWLSVLENQLLKKQKLQYARHNFGENKTHMHISGLQVASNMC